MSVIKLSIVVYQIVNERTHKFYIGSAKNFEKRYGSNPDWTKHHNTDLKQDALCGDKFIYCKIQECSSLAEALYMEQWWLDFYVMNNLFKCLYNRNRCVWRWRCGTTGMKFSKETCEKMRASRTGKKHTEATILKLRIANMGDKNPAKLPGVGAKISLAKKGKKQSQETREKRRILQTGKKRSPETRAKLSVHMINVWAKRKKDRESENT